MPPFSGASGRLLVRGGCVLTLDRTIGDLERGDVLIEDGRIGAVGPQLEGVDADVIHASRTIVMPGFVDTHRHTWQTAMRGICADWTLLEYFRGIRLNLSAEMGPEDVYAGNYVGALEALDAGVTSVLDFSHCINSPDHADEALRGLDEAGLRAVFAYGFYPVPVAEPAFETHAARIADARRVRSEHLPSDDGRIRMGIALTELGLVPLAATRDEIETARELDVLVTAHTGTVADPQWPHEIEILHREGLLDSRQVHVHCNACSDHELNLIADAGASVSVTPETEMQMGMGFPITGRALAHGLRPGFGCDIVSLGSGDVLTQLRLGLQMQRALDNDRAIADGAPPGQVALAARDGLELATAAGAEAMGLGAEVGTLSPGKAADLILISADGLNHTPRPDPVSAVVLHAHACDVDTVIVGGNVVKRDGQLLAAETARAHALADEARERIMSAAERKGGLLPAMPDGWFGAVRQAALDNLGGS